MHKHGGDIYGKTDVIDFSANINLMGIPKGVAQAAYEGVLQSAHYPDIHCAQLRKALSAAEGLPMEQIICGNGAADLIFSLVFSHKPKKALIPAPTFYEYEQALRAVGCGVEYFYLTEENQFQFTPDFLDRITPDLDMVFLCNPNNPTGCLLDRAFLCQLLSVCRERGVLVILDECFNDFLDQPETFTMKGKLGEYPNLFLLKAFTKLYAMAGLRLGYGLCANQEILGKIKEAAQPWSVSIPAQTAGIAALKETAYVRESRALIRQERAYLKEALQELGFQLYGSAANYIFFHAWEGLAGACEARGILIRDCSNYEGLGQGYYRIAVRTRPDNEKLINLFQELKQGRG